MTSAENQVAREMVALIKNIEEHTFQLNGEERIPLLELENIVSKIKTLYEKAVVLRYLHAHIDDIQNITAPAHSPEITPGNELKPVVEAQISHPEKQKEKTSLHEKIAASKSSKTLAESLGKKTIQRLSSGISLHEKLMFQKELFGGNINEYEEAIEKLESFTELPKAEEYLETTFHDKYSWGKKNEAVKLFMEILKKKY